MPLVHQIECRNRIWMHIAINIQVSLLDKQNLVEEKEVEYILEVHVKDHHGKSTGFTSFDKVHTHRVYAQILIIIHFFPVEKQWQIHVHLIRGSLCCHGWFMTLGGLDWYWTCEMPCFFNGAGFGKCLLRRFPHPWHVASNSRPLFALQQKFS